MKIIHSVIGILIILIGSLFLSITVDHDELKTITYKVFGSLTLLAGVFYHTLAEYFFLKEHSE